MRSLLRTPPGCARLSGVAFGLLALIGAAAVDASAEGLLIEPATLEIGTVAEHEEISRQLIIFNESTNAVSLRLGRSCRDCVTLALDVDLLQPGEAAVADVLFRPEGYLGEMEEFIVVETDSPAIGNVGVPVRAEVFASYTQEGAPFLIEARPDGGPVPSRWVRVTPNFAMRGALIAPTATGDVFRVRVEPDPGRKGAFLVEFAPREPLQEGMVSRTVELPSTDPADPPCRVEASVFLAPRFHVYPAALKVGPIGREQLRILFIEQFLDPPARITGVELPDDEARYEFVPDGVANLRLNLYFYAMRGKEGHVGDVVLRTDHPEVGDVRVPVIVDPEYSQELKVAGVPSGDRKKGCCGGD